MAFLFLLFFHFILLNDLNTSHFTSAPFSLLYLFDFVCRFFTFFLRFLENCTCISSFFFAYSYPKCILPHLKTNARF